MRWLGINPVVFDPCSTYFPSFSCKAYHILLVPVWCQKVPSSPFLGHISSLLSVRQSLMLLKLSSSHVDL